MYLKSSTNRELIVPDDYRLCQIDSDCTFVETRCNSCCGYVGINKEFEEIFYQEIYSPSCENYNGPVCDCIGPTEAYFLNNVCDLR